MQSIQRGPSNKLIQVKLHVYPWNQATLNQEHPCTNKATAPPEPNALINQRNARQLRKNTHKPSTTANKQESTVGHDLSLKAHFV